MKKKIALIPPSGINIDQDGFFIRFAKYTKQLDNIETYFISIKKDTDILDYNHNIIVNSFEELIYYIKKNKFDLVIHRTWMHRYKFAGELSKQIKNIIYYIKDWIIEIPKEEYQFLYNSASDYNGVNNFVNNSKLILSHYGKSYRKKLSTFYGINKEKFVFFPEYCNEENFIIRKSIKFKKNKKKHLVSAGGFTPTTGPTMLCENWNHLNVAKRITKENLQYDFYLLETTYNNVFSKKNKMIWQDWLYENKFNKNLNIKLGSRNNTRIFKNYDFAIVTGLKYNKESYYQENYSQAVISKLAFYLELGIPLIAHKKWKPIAKLVKKYNLGILISNKDVDNLDKILRISRKDYIEIVNNIYKFRKNYTYNKITMKSIVKLIN